MTDHDPDDRLYEAACAALDEESARPRDQRRGLVRAILDAVRPDFERLTSERDGAYQERSKLEAWIACGYPSVVTPATDIDEPGWKILYVTTPAGQLSWHIHPRDAHLFGHVEHVDSDDPQARWDGHTTEEKYQRIQRMAEASRCGQSLGPNPADTSPGIVTGPHDEHRNGRGMSWDDRTAWRSGG